MLLFSNVPMEAVSLRNYYSVYTFRELASQCENFALWPQKWEIMKKCNVRNSHIDRPFCGMVDFAHWRNIHNIWIRLPQFLQLKPAWVLELWVSVRVSASICHRWWRLLHLALPRLPDSCSCAIPAPRAWLQRARTCPRGLPRLPLQLASPRRSCCSVWPVLSLLG